MALTIAIPVSQADIHLLKPQVDSLEFFGGLQKHTVIFFPTPSVQQMVGTEAHRIKAVCGNTFIHALPRDYEPAGKFGAFNCIFRDVVEALSSRGNVNPWFWWEMDMSAMAGCFDRLELEYRKIGMPFMGVRRAASEVMRTKDGKPLPDDDPRAQGDYMVAVGLYPPNFKDISTMYRYPDRSGEMPTDVTIRHEINKYLHHTDLIAHHWRTGNYRRDGSGQMVCDDWKHIGGYPSYAGTVSPMAVCVHGCKDGTASQLLMSGPSTVSSPAHGAPDDAFVKQLRSKLDELGRANEQLARENRELASKNAELKQDIQNLMGDVAPPAEAARPKPTETPQNSPENISETAYEIPKLEAVHAALSGGRKVMLGDLAADLKADKNALRRLIETHGSKVKITKPGPPWCSMVE